MFFRFYQEDNRLYWTILIQKKVLELKTSEPKQIYWVDPDHLQMFISMYGSKCTMNTSSIQHMNYGIRYPHNAGLTNDVILTFSSNNVTANRVIRAIIEMGIWRLLQGRI